LGQYAAILRDYYVTPFIDFEYLQLFTIIILYFHLQQYNITDYVLKYFILHLN